jgi:hypothetical protein
MHKEKEIENTLYCPLNQLVQKIIISLKNHPLSWRVDFVRGFAYDLKLIENPSLLVHFWYRLRDTEVLRITIKGSDFEISSTTLQDELDLAVRTFYDNYLVAKKRQNEKQNEENLKYALTIL